ncbi:DNA repair and recombination protein RadA [Candidatus Woesearchaeota archaeon]|nr:DNA repair and recombination protein RadA [Candidatus Woesearchaeota archaeon]
MANKKIESVQEIYEEGVIMEEQEIKEDEIIIEKKEAQVSDLPGVGPATAEKLAKAGFDNLISIAVASIGELCDATGVTDANARKIIQAARSSLDMGFESGDALLKRRERVQKIQIPSKALNELLGGGFETGAIVEAFGQFGSSKTQIAHQLAVCCQQTGGSAVYIDTENTFRPERIKQMAEALELDSMEVLKKIKVARAYNSDHQMLLGEKVEELCKDKSLNVKVIVVDSLTALFRAEFIGRGTLATRQQKINRHMRTLAKIADKYNVCIFVTNQVMAKPDQFFGDPTEAIGGHIVGHNSTFRIYLRRGKKGTRVAKLIDSPNMAENECSFQITEAGVTDI